MLSQLIGNQGQPAVGIQVGGQLDHRLIARCCAVVAETVGGKTRGINDVTQIAHFALRRNIGLPGAIATARHRGFNGRRTLTVARKELDHAAGMIAINCRKRPTQHFDALGLIKIESRCLALPVGHAGRNAIGDQLDAAHTKG